MTALLTGSFAEPATQSARAFRAALQALSRPGTIHPIHGAVAPAPLSQAAASLLLVLADATTPIWLAPSHDTADLRDWITFHTGAPVVAAAQAMFAIGTWNALHPLDAFAIGAPDYPDRSATLIVEMPALSPQGRALRGPGIADVAHLSLPETAAFRHNRALYPQGLDFFFTAGSTIAALPRSTRVEAV